jgi:hypothetical protein
MLRIHNENSILLHREKSRKIGAGVFSTFVENTVVHERNLDTWEFGKGDLSANLNFFDKDSWATGAGANPVLG